MRPLLYLFSPVAFALLTSLALAQDQSPSDSSAASVASQEASSEQPAADASDTMPADVATLDSLAAEGPAGGLALAVRLNKETSADSIQLDLNWLQKRLHQGAGYAMAFYYFEGLTRQSYVLQQTASAPGLRDQSATIYLYSIVLLAVDGARCADPSAPLLRLGSMLAPPWSAYISFIRGQPPATRQKYIDDAVNLETETAAFRGAEDQEVCLGGADERARDWSANGVKPLVGSIAAPGATALTYAVPIAPGYIPQLISRDQWDAKEAAARVAVLNELAAITGVVRQAVPPTQSPAQTGEGPIEGTAPPVVANIGITRLAVGGRSDLTHYYRLNTDCTPDGEAVSIRIIEQPKHGTLVVHPGQVKAYFPPGPYGACDSKLVPGTIVTYMADGSYTGIDYAEYIAIEQDRTTDVRAPIYLIERR